MRQQAMDRLRINVLFLMKEKGWDRLDLSVHSHVHDKTIYRILSGNYKNTSLEVVSKLSDAFGVDITVLFRKDITVLPSPHSAPTFA